VTLLLILGGIGLLGLVVGLVVGDLDVDVDLGPDWLSIPVLAALVGAFGFVGAAALSLGAPMVAALLVGAIGGLALAWAAARLTRGLMHMRTDAPVRSSDMVGRPGRVVTALTPAQGGEVLVRHAGQQLKLAARGDEVLRVGDQVVVVEVLSPTLVRVESHGRFWDHDADPSLAPPTPDPGGPTP
jgi:membrane protein implicated in regulation of membrane protease activity